MENFSNFQEVLLGRGEGMPWLRLGALAATLLPLTLEVGPLPLRPVCSGSVLSPLLQPEQCGDSSPTPDLFLLGPASPLPQEPQPLKFVCGSY